MASRNGTSRIERLLPKSLRMRFFSVNEYFWWFDLGVEAVLMWLPPR